MAVGLAGEQENREDEEDDRQANKQEDRGEEEEDRRANRQEDRRRWVGPEFEVGYSEQGPGVALTPGWTSSPAPPALCGNTYLSIVRHLNWHSIDVADPAVSRTYVYRSRIVNTVRVLWDLALGENVAHIDAMRQ